jgi:WXXGXW repeat (2 copies)
MRISLMRPIRYLALTIAAFTIVEFATPMFAAPAAASPGISISVTIAPPELPVYEQPVCPGDGYIWTPGYWAWDGDDYYWVPGTWVLAPEPGLLWTPAYWGWNGGDYVFYPGYWGPQVGFYGGIDYGFGYGGRGYDGGRWDNGHFFYNRSVNNVNVTVVHNVYNTTVVNENRNVPRASFNGGNGGVNARPTSQEEAAARERHVAPVAAQNQQMQTARSNSQLRASENHGNPPIAATTKPGAFGERDVVAARGGSYNPPARPANAPKSPAIHPNELAPTERPAAPNTGNAKLDKKYQQQQQKLSTQQDQARQKLQQQQDRDHQRMTQQNANDARRQQVEQQHQQQTQQMMQKQNQQQQRMQQRQQPARQQQPAAQPKGPEEHGSNEHH